MAYGLKANTNNIVSSVNTMASQSPNGLTASPASFKAGRVKSIILDNNHPKFKKFGEWNALGVIEYQDITLPASKTAFARPYFSNIKQLPVLEEIIWIVTLPDTSLNGTPDKGGITTNTSDYYICPASLWNHPHHNAFPSNPEKLPQSQQKDYIQTQAGNVRRVTDQSTEIDLGNTFIERSNIHPLLPFEGDIIYEGRWGNSIRFGSTNKRKIAGIIPDALNNWSKGKSTSGDPIIIFRNGQGTQTEEGWIPITEDINNDDASIYLTSTQKIPLKTASSNYFSYKKNTPEQPDQYIGKQIIISSGRLVFNSSLDHILLSSNKTINLNAVLGVNIDTPTVTIQSQNIFLGSKNANEPLLLGNQTVNLLNQLIENIQAFSTICSTLVSTPPGTPLAPLNTAALQLNGVLDSLQSNLNNLKSKYNYTV